MDVDDLRLLLDLKRTGSFTGAARQARVAVSTVARRIEALESRLKLRLVDKRMNGARLTPEGERIAALADPVVDGLARIARTAAALRQGSERETVLVSATEFIVSDILAPALPGLLAGRADLTIVLRSEAAVISLAAREADIAVRMSRPQGNSLVARRLPEQRLGLFASTAYLAGRAPEEIDLRRERLLVYDDSYGRLPELDWIAAHALDASVALRTGSTRALLEATIHGGGVGLLPRSAATRAGLTELPPPSPLGGRAPWLVVHRDLRRVPAIRAVLAWVADAFARASSASALP